MITVWVPVLIAVIAPLGAYILAVRKMSGKIATSDADALWRESGQIRDDYRMRLHDAMDRIAGLETRVASVEAVNAELVQENAGLTREVSRLTSENVKLREQVADLQLANKELEWRIKVLTGS